VAALGDIARAKGMSQIARDAGLGRESLYRALSTTGNPEFATILEVVRALAMRSPVWLGRAASVMFRAIWIVNVHPRFSAFISGQWRSAASNTALTTTKSVVSVATPSRTT
jgi:hypothetical protein